MNELTNFITLIKAEYNKKQTIKDLIITDNLFNPANQVKYINIMTNKQETLELNNLYVKNSYINCGYKKLDKFMNITFIQLNKKISINIYYENKTPNIKQLINSCIKRICCMLAFFHKNILETFIDFNILLYYAPRIIYKEYENNVNEFNKFENLSYFNCTCGWYINNNKHGEIFVSRINGCLGLLIHELCHLCKLDFGGYNSFTQWKDYYKQHISKYNPGNLSEGINNAISSIMHAVFLSCESNINYNKYYSQEYYHCLRQCRKLIRYFKCSSLKELLNKKIYVQIGQVFEYVVLKYIYLKNIDKLFHISLNNTNNLINSSKYYNLFIKLLENDELSCNTKIHDIDYQDFKYNNINKLYGKNIISMEYYYNL